MFSSILIFSLLSIFEEKASKLFSLLTKKVGSILSSIFSCSNTWSTDSIASSLLENFVSKDLFASSLAREKALVPTFIALSFTLDNFEIRLVVLGTNSSLELSLMPELAFRISASMKI